MIRIHLVLLLALAQAVFSERMIMQLATGGRGQIMITNFFDPWVTMFLVAIPFWKDLRRVLGEREFLLVWMPFLGLSFVMPFLAVIFGDYPVRSLYSAWNAILPFSFLSIGIVGRLRANEPGVREAGPTIAVYFLVGVLSQAFMALVQIAGGVGNLPSFLQAVYQWDFDFKEAAQPDSVILGRATGFYLNPNSLGIWAILSLWTSFFMLKGKVRVVAVVASILTVICCGSRGSLVAMVGSATVYGLVWMVRRASHVGRLKATFLAAILAIPLLVFALPGVGDSFLGSFRGVPVIGAAVQRYVSGAKVLSEGAGADANFKERTELWHAAADFLKEHPFGSMGSPRMMVGVSSDNLYVAVLEQGSFYYLFALLLFFYGGLRLMNSPRTSSRLLAVATLGLAINGISAVPTTYPSSFLYWFLLGVHLAEGVLEREALLPENAP